MKKNVLALFAIMLLTASVKGQSAFNYVGLDVEGFYNLQDSTKRYVVLRYDDISQKELYEFTKIFIDKKFSQFPKKVNIVEHKSIVLDVADVILFEFASNKKGASDVVYSADFAFRDNAVKIEISPVFVIRLGKNEAVLKGTNSPFIGMYPIYDNKGTLKREQAKKQVEYYFNSLLFDLDTSIKDSHKEEEW